MGHLKRQSITAAERLSVLVAEDNAVMQTVIKFLLASWGYLPVIVTDGERAWEILQGGSAPRLALLDWMIPGLDGVELCRRIRAAGTEPYTYVLLLSARADSADLVKAMDAGADDYLRKPFDAQELRARLNAGSRIVLLQQQLLEAREGLREQAMRDSLTGVLNHRAILEALGLQIEGRREAGEPLSAVLVDIDRFRQINDSFGRPAGDELLCEAARRLRAASPPEAILGRYGGEGFLIILPRCGLPAARLHAAALRDAICSSSVTAGAASFPVCCSVGAACSESAFARDAATLLRELDESLFRAKRDRPSPSAAPATALEPLALSTPSLARP